MTKIKKIISTLLMFAMFVSVGGTYPVFAIAQTIEGDVETQVETETPTVEENETDTSETLDEAETTEEGTDTDTDTDEESETMEIESLQIESGDSQRSLNFFGNFLKGKVRVCKIILDEEGNVISGTAEAGSEFSITGSKHDETETATWNTPLTLNAQILDGSEENDAQCYERDGVSFGTYNYEEEEIDSEDEWMPAKYYDQLSYGTLDLEDLEIFGDSNKSDGKVVVSAFKKNVTLVIVNQLAGDNGGEEDTATIHAHKIVCDSEEDLPNWGAGDSTLTEVTSNTATRFLNAHPNCEAVDWTFEWADTDTTNPGDNMAEGGNDWTEFTGSTTVPAGERVWVREQIKDGYIPFTGENTTEDISAELYCHTDILNYDNFEFIEPVEEGGEYHCIAFNVLEDGGDSCEAEPNGSWADEVESSSQGDRKDGSNVLAGRSDPTLALGESDWDPGDTDGFFALGFGGSVVLSFDSFVPDVSGTDLIIHEATNGTYPAETAEIDVSQNGTDWEFAGPANNLSSSKTTEIDFSGTGLSWIKYVRISDTTNPTLHTNDADGFDLDAVEVMEQVCEEPDTTDPDPEDGVVHILKYIDGVQATAELADDASFPMFTSTFSASFTLDNDGWTTGDDPYEASTSTMAGGASYTANEDLTTSLVGESCEEGKSYALVGYTHGDTLVEAQSATKTTTAPNITVDGDKYIIVWNEKCGDVGGATTVRVHIHKYLDNGEGSAQVANGSGIPHFPMTATWMAANLNGGASTSGNYVLGNNHGGATMEYAAITSPMEAPADYTTSEITDGSVVVANEDACVEGKYYLVGYKWGNTLAQAEAATMSTTAPNFTDITSDKHVIVINNECPDENGGGGGDNEGSIKITKYECPADTEVVRSQNGVGGMVPEGCVLEQGETFGYVHGTATNTDGPYPELEGPFVAGGTTDANGVLMIDNLEATGRYLIVETDNEGNQMGEDEILGLYCEGDGDTSDNNDNQELTFVTDGGTSECIAYNIMDDVACDANASSDYMSDTTTTVDGSASVAVAPINAGWTASIPGATWIWSTATFDATIDSEVTFTKEINIGGAPKDSTLMIAADNTYEVYVNGLLVGSSTDENNFQAETQDTITITADKFVSGENTITFVVTNMGTEGTDELSNPAGLMYKLIVNNDECDDDNGGGGGNEENISIRITKYSCPDDTVVTRAANGVGGTVPEGCDLFEGSRFGYVHGIQTDTNAPFPELEGPFVTAGTTNASGVLTLNDLDDSGRYLIVETDEAGNQMDHDDILGLYCEGDAGTENDNQELTFVIDGEIADCIAYNKDSITGNEDGEVQGASSSSSRSSGSSRRNRNNGEVLGAQSGCSIYVDKFLRAGYNNDPEIVRKVQNALNTLINAGLTVNGVYDAATIAAVNRFQMQHGPTVLSPWGINIPTGIFYLTTSTQMNNIMCPELQLPIPSNLINFSQNPDPALPDPLF